MLKMVMMMIIKMMMMMAVGIRVMMMTLAVRMMMSVFLDKDRSNHSASDQPDGGNAQDEEDHDA